jgi:hypothetical protein
MIQFGFALAAVRLLMAFGMLTIEGHLLAGYTAIAHVYMGVLLHSWWINRYEFRESIYYWFVKQPWQWRFFWFMNTVEVFSFFVSRI